MRRGRLSIFVSGILISLVLVIAGCGGGEKNKGGNQQTSASERTLNTSPLENAKKGGHITFLAAGDVDYADPGQTYYTFGYQLHYAVHRTLYGFKPPDFSKPIPDLAEGDPQISSDNKTITIKIHKGVKYSPGTVDRDVQADDFKYAFERAAAASVANGYFGAYFGDIEGAPAKPPEFPQDISGLQTPDKYTFVIKLSKAAAVSVSQALVMPITSPVPREWASKYDKQNPSTYNTHVAFTGPYQIKADASGKVTGHQPGKSIEIVRNANWNGPETGDPRPAYLDSITIDEGNDDTSVSSRETLQGTKTMCCDAGQPPVAILAQVLANDQYKPQIGRSPSGGTRWIALNSTIKPFDNLNVRKAVIASFDRDALRKTRGGSRIGPVAQHWIPPGIPGYEESGGEKGFTDLDFFQHPTGDLDLAHQYMMKAKAEGVPVDSKGNYAGGEKLLTIATNAAPGVDTATVAQAQFGKLGFKLNFRKVPQDTLYTKFCNVPKAKVAVCPNVGWFKDFTDPQSMLEPTFSGNAILPSNNNNWTQLNDPKINAAMDKAALIPVGSERNKAWADINHMITADAPGVPFVWDDSISLSSKDVRGVYNGYYTSWDFAYSALA